MEVVASDADLAIALAGAAGDVLLQTARSGVLKGRALGDAGDLVANALLTRALRAHRPDDGILSEEAADDRERLASRRVWIIDPLDGTREYGEGREDWAVHIALAVDGAPVAAAVAVPARGRVYAASPSRPLPARAAGPLRIAVSRSRAPELARAVAARLDAELVPMGSAGFKAMAVVDGDVDAYLHAGGQYEWDSAAPAGVAVATGLHASRIDGSPLRYNQPDPSLPDLLISRRELAEPLLNAIDTEAR